MLIFETKMVILRQKWSFWDKNGHFRNKSDNFWKKLILGKKVRILLKKIWNLKKLEFLKINWWTLKKIGPIQEFNIWYTGEGWSKCQSYFQMLYSPNYMKLLAKFSFNISPNHLSFLPKPLFSSLYCFSSITNFKLKNVLKFYWLDKMSVHYIYLYVKNKLISEKN